MEIKRKSSVSYEEFIEEHYKPGIPLVFTNAAKVWDANGLFTPSWFRDNYPERTTKINGKVYTMREVMDMVEASSAETPAPYPCTFNIPSTLPELLPLLQPLNLNYAYPNWLESRWFKRGGWGNLTELFVGGAGGKFPYLHKDYYHLSAWITQLYGEKRFTVFPRDQEDMLYPDPPENWRSKVNILNPDYTKFPKFKNATPIDFTVGPGETLYIPFGIWHTAYSLSPTISVAFDQLSGLNQKGFMKDVWNLNPNKNLKSVVRYSYAWAATQSCKLGDMLGVKRG